MKTKFLSIIAVMCLVAVANNVSAQSASGNVPSGGAATGVPKPLPITVFPNPTDGELNVQVDSKFVGERVIRVIDGQGNIKLSVLCNTCNGSFTYLLNVKSLEPGNYMVQVTDGTAKMLSRRFRKI